MKPNLFEYAPKELSQDGFFAWFMRWADSDCSFYNLNLAETSRDFIRLLINQGKNFDIISVEVKRQWRKIDIVALVNNHYLIIIEDKTTSSEHSHQLNKYKNIAYDFSAKKDYQPTLIYLKTGNESLSSLQAIRNKGYTVVGRKDLLNIFNKREIKNDVFEDFNAYLASIDNQTNSCESLYDITRSVRSGEGFFINLQENILASWSHWKYVPNQMGGFLGLWYHFREVKGVGQIYIQIENAFQRGIELVVKITKWTPKVQTLRQVLRELNALGLSKNLVLAKPRKYRVGETSTVAIVKSAFSDYDSFSIDKLTLVLRSVESIIDEYCDLMGVEVGEKPMNS